MVDQRGVAGDTAPRHVHRDEEEVFSVREGSIRAFHGGTTLDLDTGSAISLPAAQEHAFGIVSDRARILTLTTPGSSADLVTAAGVAVDGEVPARWDFDVDRIGAAAADHRIDLTGPPPALN